MANEPLRSPSKRGLVVAIDGAAGAGKSTLARGLAAELGLPYVNTGLMYRALARCALRERLDPADGSALAERTLALSFAIGQGHPRELVVDGVAPDATFKLPEVEVVVSDVSAHPAVRSVMRRAQRELGLDGAVMEGRDIGSVVFPDADVKIYLRASGRIRAERRAAEHGGGRPSDEVATAVARRDRLDSKTNPFVPTPDARVIDTDDLAAEQVLREALRLVLAATGSDRS